MIASIILWYKHLLLIDSGQKQAKVVASRVTNDLVVTILDKRSVSPNVHKYREILIEGLLFGVCATTNLLQDI